MTTSPSPIQRLDLNGKWNVVETGSNDCFQAQVPGCIHTDLMRCGRIPDPFYGMNELDVLWVGDKSWTYSRTFTIDADILNQTCVELVCDGLDTLAQIMVNGHLIANTDNMFRSYVFDLKNSLNVGENTIEIVFKPAAVYGKKKIDERCLPNWGVEEGDKLPGVNYLRKAQYHFGWDWGPKLATCGIWKDIAICAHSNVRLDDVWILQHHSQNDNIVTVSVEVSVNAIHAINQDEKCKINVDMTRIDDFPLDIPEDITYKQKERHFHVQSECLPSKVLTFDIVIKNPGLWWPNGLGKPHRYRVTVNLKHESGDRIESVSRTVGLRTLSLIREPDEWGESFHFQVNGVPFFAKGGNWIPADSFLTRVDEERYRRLISDCRDVNMNMIRVWGGGIYESEVFYDLCDTLGICVWQDFMFSCAGYPVFDPEWLQNVTKEAEENVKRLRNHACIALFCGNNELEQGLVGDEYTRDTMSWTDYSLLFDKILREVVERLSPSSTYWPGSPHSPLGNRVDFNNAKWGDAHLWGVWHGKEPFEWYQQCEHRFNSEFGFQSFPEPSTVVQYAPKDERNVTSLVMEHHQRSQIGNETIIQYMLEWFRMPHSFNNLLWLSQITQALAMQFAVEHWRRSMPRGMGTLYWQINDCWPVASWSSIDYFGRWKALHYIAKGFYNPVLISGVVHKNKMVVDIFVSNDKTAKVVGSVLWELRSTSGQECLMNGRFDVSLNGSASTKVESLDFSSHSKFTKHDVILFYRLIDGDNVLSENMNVFIRPKHLKLLNPRIEWELINDSGIWGIKIECVENCALWMFITVGEKGNIFGDMGFFHMHPEMDPKVVLLRDNKGEYLSCSEEELALENIRILSLHELSYP